MMYSAPACGPALPALGVEPLRVVRERLVDPHVGLVLHGDVVAPPLVRALVHDDEVPLQAEAGAGEVAAEVAVAVVVAIGDGALVLHAEVRRLDQLVPVRGPRIRPEPVLVALHHRRRLAELPARGVEVIGERPEVHGERSRLAHDGVGVVGVGARVDGDVVVVDRRGDEPLERRGAVGVVRGAPEPPVGDVHDRVRHRDRDALAVRLVGEVVLVGPPDAGAESLARGGDPAVAQAVRCPGEAAVPRRAARHAGLPMVPDRDGAGLSGPLPRGE